MTAEPTHLISVLTPDHPGIVHALVNVLDAHGAGADEISQTVVAGAFTITLVVSVPPDIEPASLATELAGAAGDGASASLLPIAAARAATGSPARAERYLLTAITGNDDEHALIAITRAVGDRRGNFVDFASQRSEQGLRLVAELELAGDGGLTDLQDALSEIAASVPGRTVRLQHERLFAATSEVAFRRLGR